MEWLGKLLSRSNKTKRDYLNLTRGKDPLEIWNKTGEIGDGAFGKVYRVSTAPVQTECCSSDDPAGVCVGGFSSVLQF